MTEADEPEIAPDPTAQPVLSSGWQWALNIGVPSIYPGALVVFWLAPMHFGFGHDGVVYAGWILGGFGLLLWIVSTVHLGGSLAVLPGSKQLVTKGVYRYIRHPVYLGISCTLIGLALCLGSLWGLIYVLLIVLPVNVFRAVKEDQALSRQFGDSYRQWRSRTWI